MLVCICDKYINGNYTGKLGVCLMISEKFRFIGI